MSIQELFTLYTRTPSDINEHLTTLFTLTKDCDIITEFGTREGHSTSAFAAAIENTNKRLICYDLYKSNSIDIFLKQKNVQFHQTDTLKCVIENTDLLFIDTLHTYFQLFNELKTHSKFVKKYIVLHDTHSYGLTDEPFYNQHSPVKMSEKVEKTQKQGLRTAIDDFLNLTEDGKNWKVEKIFTNNNGLSILERHAE